MTAEMELWTRSGRSVVALDRDRVAIGKDPSNDLAITDDRTVSAMHAVLERFPAGWCVNDLGSSNGTFLNGERIFGLRRLRHGDEVRVGQARLVFRHGAELGRSATQADVGPPSLTAREHDVLRVLCRPLLDRDLFTEPASVREVASELVVSEAAVKQHLTNLYVKFEIFEDTPHRRARLANAALRRGAVTLADLQNKPER